jgi:teichuronic acid biosynthesis glycosyltransferase TuaH
MRITYLMHVSWFWAKQRPQFIAQHLSKENKITVFYPQQFGKKENYVKNLNPNLKIKYFRRIPGIYKIRLLGLIHDLIVACQLWSDIRKTDVVWVTHPFLYRFLFFFNFSTNVKLVYDCMDDVLEFPDIVNNVRRRKSILELEKALVSRSKIVFSTSHYLSEKLKKRYGSDLNLKLVNNAINIDSFTKKSHEELPEVIQRCFRDDCVNIVYAGTISSWLDLDLIRKSIAIQDKLNYILLGPSEIFLQNQERLNFPGPIKHELVPALLKRADVLIMPFILSELILSVNPVKLYEYIYSNKPIVSIRYEETEQFAPYVMLYKNEEEYLKIMQQFVQGDFPALDVDGNQSFVKNNTWNNRVEIIQQCLRKEI